MEFAQEELLEAKKQIDSTLHKLRETVKTLEAKENPNRYKSQITLAKRRIKAFEIANYLIENEAERKADYLKKIERGIAQIQAGHGIVKTMEELEKMTED